LGLLGKLEPDPVLRGAGSLFDQPISKLADRVSATIRGNLRALEGFAVRVWQVPGSLPRIPIRLEAIYRHKPRTFYPFTLGHGFKVALLDMPPDSTRRYA
jgi:hypothetical protein